MTRARKLKPLLLRDKTATLKQVRRLASRKGCTARVAGRTLAFALHPISGVVDANHLGKALIGKARRPGCPMPSKGTR